MRAAIQINGAEPCPVWRSLAEEFNIETIWVDDNTNVVEANPDFVLTQYWHSGGHIQLG